MEVLDGLESGGIDGGDEPHETDFHDMRLLHERLGTDLLPPFDGR